MFPYAARDLPYYAPSSKKSSYHDIIDVGHLLGKGTTNQRMRSLRWFNLTEGTQTFYVGRHEVEVLVEEWILVSGRTLVSLVVSAGCTGLYGQTVHRIR